MFKKILVPVDGSELAEQALPKATELAKLSGAELLLVRVVLPPLTGASPRAAQTLAETRKALHAKTLEYLEALDTEATHHVVEGSPERAILELAEAEGVDLIALTSHGETGLGRWLFGSTAERLVKYAKCTVMVFKSV